MRATGKVRPALDDVEAAFYSKGHAEKLIAAGVLQTK